MHLPKRIEPNTRNLCLALDVNDPSAFKRHGGGGGLSILGRDQEQSLRAPEPRGQNPTEAGASSRQERRQELPQLTAGPAGAGGEEQPTHPSRRRRPSQTCVPPSRDLFGCCCSLVCLFICLFVSLTPFQLRHLRPQGRAPWTSFLQGQLTSPDHASPTLSPFCPGASRGAPCGTQNTHAHPGGEVS